MFLFPLGISFYVLLDMSRHKLLIIPMLHPLCYELWAQNGLFPCTVPILNRAVGTEQLIPLHCAHFETCHGYRGGYILVLCPSQIEKGHVTQEGLSDLDSDADYTQGSSPFLPGDKSHSSYNFTKIRQITDNSKISSLKQIYFYHN